MARGVLALAALAAAAVTGCTSNTATPKGGDQGNARQDVASTPIAEPVAGAVPYRLYTHCGIDWENVGGNWFEAQPPISDGHGNPPAGWGNPYQDGTITMLSPARAEFRDAAGHIVILVLRRGVTRPPYLCS
jgi:hypothetical protein